MRSIRHSRRAAVAGIALVTGALFATSGYASATASAPKQGTRGTQAPKLKGAPVKVMTIGTAGAEEGGNVPAMAQMAFAYQGFINHNGGINDRPLKVFFCSDNDNPTGALQCARQAVSDNVVAVVGWGSVSGGSNILQVLSRANIPWIGEEQFGTAENTSPDSYPDHRQPRDPMAGHRSARRAQGVQEGRRDGVEQPGRYLRSAVVPAGL